MKTQGEMAIALVKDLLDPERFGFAVTAEVRDAARRVLGIEAGETVKVADLLGAERECCGTFFRTRHRATCPKFRGKKS